MCDACNEKFERLTESSNAVKADWTCEACGCVSFEQEADPFPPPSQFWRSVGENLFLVAMLVFGAVAMILAAVMDAKK